MEIIWGIIIILFSVLAWLGQVISAISYKKAEALGLADIKGEVIWDSLILWILPLPGFCLFSTIPYGFTLDWLVGAVIYIFREGVFLCG